MIASKSRLESTKERRKEAIFSLKRWLVAQSTRIASAASTETTPTSYQLDNDVLCAQDRQRVLPERCFLQGSSYRARVVDGQSATAVQGDRDGSTLAGAQPSLRCEAQKHFQFGRIIDALLGDLRRIQCGGVSRLLIRIGVGDLRGDVIGGDE